MVSLRVWRKSDMGSTSSRRWIECPFHLHWNALSLPCPVVRKKQLIQISWGSSNKANLQRFLPGRLYKIKCSLTSFSFPFSLFPQGRHDAAGWNTNSSLCTHKHLASNCSGRKIKKDSVYSGRNYFHALAALAGRQQYSPPLLWHTQTRSTNLFLFSFVMNCK